MNAKLLNILDDGPMHAASQECFVIWTATPDHILIQQESTHNFV
jgi:hypothetical protein